MNGDQGSISPTYLCAAFARLDPKRVKRKADNLTIFFTLLGSASSKAAR